MAMHMFSRVVRLSTTVAVALVLGTVVAHARRQQHATATFEVRPPTSNPFMNSVTHHVNSSILGGEERYLRVFSVSGEQGVDGGGDCTGCPVLYVLDQDDWGYLVASLTDTLAKYANVPRIIIVGVINVDRNREMLPPLVRWPKAPASLSHAGGADDFLRYLTDEVMPFIDETYHAAPYRILFGHSFGADFAMHAFSTRPLDSFNAFICMSISAWYDSGAPLDRLRNNLQKLVKADETAAAAAATEPIKFYHTVGGEGGIMLQGAHQLLGIMESALHTNCNTGVTRIGKPGPARDLPELGKAQRCSRGTEKGEWFAEDKWHRVTYKFRPWYSESHHSQVFRGLEDGLRWIFQDHIRTVPVESYSRLVTSEEACKTGLCQPPSRAIVV